MISTAQDPIGRKIVIASQRDYQSLFHHIQLGIINPVHETRQKFAEKFQQHPTVCSIPAKNIQIDGLDVVGNVHPQPHVVNPESIFNNFNLKEMLPQHIIRPYIYVTRVNRRITYKERGALAPAELEALHYHHSNTWNNSTHLKSTQLVKNTSNDAEKKAVDNKTLTKEEREQFYEQSQKETQFIFDFYKLIKHLLRKRNQNIVHLKNELLKYIKVSKKLVDSEHILMNKQELTEFLKYLGESDLSEEKIFNFFNAAVKGDEQKLSMRALVYNVSRYYENKHKIHQKFSVQQANRLNTQIKHDACYWTFNAKSLEKNLDSMREKESEALKKVKVLWGDKYETSLKGLIDERDKMYKTRLKLAKFFKESLQLKQSLEMEMVAKACIDRILNKSKDIALFSNFVHDFFESNPDKKNARQLTKEELAQFLIANSYAKEDSNVIIERIIKLFDFAHQQKKNKVGSLNKVEKETFLEFLKVKLRKQENGMRMLVKMMMQIQRDFEEQVETKEIGAKSAKKYEWNMTANFIVKYLSKIERQFLKAQWKIMCVLKAIEQDQLTQKKMDQILAQTGIPASFTLKFLFAENVFIKKKQYSQQPQMLAWKMHLQKALGIYKQEIQKMNEFFADMGHDLDSSGVTSRNSEADWNQKIDIVQEVQEEAKESVKEEKSIHIDLKYKYYKIFKIDDEENESDESESLSSFSTDVDYLSNQR